MTSAPDLDARALAALYDEGYYHGVNSGYPAAGYESEHASWRHWVEHLATRVETGARWLDLGCAYGYLVAEATAAGFATVGVDVSAYALARARTEASTAVGRLVRGVATRLPFPDASFGVVSAFDVLEHVNDPEPVLAEAARVLKPGGILIAATPDPLHFGRHEDTHFSERPPSFWIDRLLALGFEVDFRFFQAAYNLELLAVRTGAARVLPAGGLRPEGFGTGRTIGDAVGPARERVAVRVRAGLVAAPQPDAVEAYWSGESDARFYCLVTGREPCRLTFQIEACAEHADELVVQLGDQEVGRAPIGATARTVTLPSLPVAAGGHDLRIRARTPLLVRRLEIVAEPVTRVELLARLPFDMYQRYDHARAATAKLGTRPRRILDVGGVMGGAHGHFASLADFFPDDDATVVDVRMADHPDHRDAAEPPLPFADASFDVVSCQDVLEHVPPDGRAVLLDELRRVSRRFVVLGAPFATPGVRDADAVLFAHVKARHGYEHGFLREHLTHGHPELAATVAHFEKTGASVVVLPNGYLPYWTLMQAANLLLAEPALGARYARGQSLYNGQVADWREPAYRHLVIVDLTGATDWCGAVRRLVTNDGDADAADRRLRDAAAIDAILTLATAAAPTSAASSSAQDPSPAARDVRPAAFDVPSAGSVEAIADRRERAGIDTDVRMPLPDDRPSPLDDRPSPLDDRPSPLDDRPSPLDRRASPLDREASPVPRRASLLARGYAALRRFVDGLTGNGRA